MRRYKIYLILFLLLFGSNVSTFSQTRNNLVMAKDHLILLIDVRSSRAQIDSMLRMAGINGASAELILKNDFNAPKKDGWNITRIDQNTIQFDRSLNELTLNPQKTPFQITSKLIKTETRPGYPSEVMYGVNSFSKNTAFLLPSGLTRFYVPGNLKARRVLLSGNFNDWSTLKGTMARTDSGWVADVKLEPGIYAYKYIIDGHWTVDVYNNNNQNDGVGNVNSIYYRYNYTFKLPGYASARHVTAAGSFNNWNGSEIEMYKVGDSWKRSLYLHDGMFAYRFMVDGQWIPDPLNPVTKKDAAGGVRSVLNLGETVNFKLPGFPNARNVFVAGDFNNWKTNELRMTYSGNAWVLPYTFAAGNYGYKFIVDGRWVTDPQNPHYVNYKGENNSFMCIKPNRTFVLKGYKNAKTIRLSGTFNNWAEDSYNLVHQGDEWHISLNLKPGKYLYKFIVDGNWIIDPGNRLWEQNEHNTGNSVIWID